MRILIYGACGAGKTGLAGRLGERLGIPVVSSDEILMDEFWKRWGKDEEKKKLDFFKENGSWVFEGVGALKIVEERGLAIDCFVLLDYPKRVVLRRIFERFREGRKRGSVYGRLRSLVNLLFYLLFYSSEKSLRLVDRMREDGVSVFVVRGDDDLGCLSEFLES